jgi:hypothetical protein
MNQPLDFANPGHDVAALPDEKRAETRYDACHDDDDFASLKQRAVFSRESAGLYRQWLHAAVRELANEQARGPDLGSTPSLRDVPVCAGATRASAGADTSNELFPRETST